MGVEICPFPLPVLWLRAFATAACTSRDYAYIFYRFRVIASYLSKVANFDVLILHLASTLGMTPLLSFAEILGVTKPESLCYRAALFACLRC